MYFSPANNGLKRQIAVSACVSDIDQGQAEPPSEILLIPAGPFRARDGRPETVEAWFITASTAQRIIQAAEAAAGDFVIDYEHQTLKTDINGQPAPAAGWFKRLEWREGQGLYAIDVKWTEAAKAAIAAGEYRYISPVFEWDRNTGEVISILMAALTNFPAIDGHSDLAARAAARFATQQEDDHVDKTKLAKLLGLEQDASDEQITEAFTALKAKADQLEAKEREITALKAKAEAKKPDPAKYVPTETFEALKAEVAALRAERTKSQVEALVAKGIEDGKLLPAQEKWAKDLGELDIEALKKYLDNTPAIAALRGTQTGGKAPDGDGAPQLKEHELAVCRRLGIDPKDYQKHAATQPQ